MREVIFTIQKEGGLWGREGRKIDRNGTGRGKLSRVPFFETKRIEMNNHVLK